MTVINTDVVVIGSGSSGMAAALSASEQGLKVAIFEKMRNPGGRVKGGNGPFAVESKMQRERQFDFTKEDAFNLFMEHTRWRVDARLVSNYVNKSGDTIEWLQKAGIKFNDVVAYYTGAEFTWHFRDEENSPKITDALFEKAKANGAEIYLDSPVKKILKDGEKVTGVLAQTKEGEIEVRAKAVIIATGGFGGNAEWINKYTGFTLGKDLFPFPAPELEGDGIRLAWEAGAGKSDMMLDTFVCLPEPYWGPGGTHWDLGTFRQPNLMVNLDGERFMNEEAMKNPAYGSNAVRRQKRGCAFMIVDEGISKYYEEAGWDFLLSRVPVTKSPNLGGEIRKAKADGYQHLFEADSLEDLCNQTGINLDGLKNTLEEYNNACQQGNDDTFHKSSKYLKPFGSSKFYAARFYNNAYGSLGGIKINYKTQVVTAEQDVIPGLYAVGKDANAIYDNTYIFAMSGNDTAFDFNTGRIAGEQVARYIKSLG
ncbi:MAG: fumarate reductase/succinate dehydrogenase flavoprotein [Firmicutes bacterium]|nr:fumarate reductase/succinate dehydrogenase flavoprotein [Bacillota bacterium]